ncbi:TetR/AcrR family transcriptional regulator [soil metagenome]
MPSPARGLTQPQRVEASSRRLVEAAAELVTEKGWEATTAAEIGRRAGYSRAMVHARYGSKDAILDAFIEHGYVQQVLPGLQPGATGMENAVAHFGRIQDMYAQDRSFLRAMFVMTFEAVKTTSPVRSRLQIWFERGVDAVENGLRSGILDGSVRPDIDLDKAVSDISTAAFGIAFHWIVLPEHYDLARELGYARERVTREYGRPS